MKVSRLIAVLLTFCLLMSLTSSIAESDWPAQNITVIIPAKAGGVNDSIARVMQEYFKSHFNANMVVTNYDTKAVAYEMLHSAKNDGYTIMLQHSTLFAEAAGGTVPYNPVEELTVLAETNTLGASAYIGPVNAPYKTLSELISYAKDNPGRVTAGYSAMGMSHMQWAALMQQAGIELMLVDASSESEKLTNVAGGFIGLCATTYKAAKEYADAGQLNILAVGNNPDAVAEFGYESLEDLGYTTMVTNYMYIWGPKGIDDEVADKINSCFRQMTDDLEFQERMNSLGFPAYTETREQAKINAATEMEAAYGLAESIGLR